MIKLIVLIHCKLANNLRYRNDKTWFIGWIYDNSGEICTFLVTYASHKFLVEYNNRIGFGIVEIVLDSASEDTEKADLLWSLKKFLDL